MLWVIGFRTYKKFWVMNIIDNIRHPCKGYFMENKYFSVSKFAEMANVTRQAVYRRIDKDLKEFVVEENGVKKISVNALQLFNSASEQKEIISNENVDIIPIASKIDEGLKIVQVVDKTLHNKDKQIESLLKIIDDMQKTIDKLSDKKKPLFKRLFSRNGGDK